MKVQAKMQWTEVVTLNTVSLLHIIRAVSKISLTEPWFPAEAVKPISLSTGPMGKKISLGMKCL